MSTLHHTAHAVAMAFLAGECDVSSMVNRAIPLFSHHPRWLRGLARRAAKFLQSQATPVRQKGLIEFIQDDKRFRFAHSHDKAVIRRWVLYPPTMRPVGEAKGWNVPTIETIPELASWLDISVRDLGWFTDGRQTRQSDRGNRVEHYHYRAVFKRFGNVRLIEAPKVRLKTLQRRVLTDILEHIPPHVAAHGFRPGRSIQTFAAIHTNQVIVLRIDLHDFFPTIGVGWVQAIFRTAGYPEGVARTLAALCTNRVVERVWNDVGLSLSSYQLRWLDELYGRLHLPQGAPTSPALANLCAYRLDQRLAGLANAASANYTRYADDLAFSGSSDFVRQAANFQHHVCATVMEEGFRVHFRKTRIMRRATRQQLVGLVVNDRLNVRRTEFDKLKAILTNCVRHGLESQNRDQQLDFRAYLNGRIAFVESVNPHKAMRLRILFEKIAW